MDALFSWAETRQAAPKLALGKALHYLKEQRPYLMNYLKDGRLELSNNRAEHSIKPFVIDRKNFLFANTPGGAQGSAVIFSLIKTAKGNGLDPYRYLAYVLGAAPVLERTGDNWATPLLPASAPEKSGSTEWDEWNPARLVPLTSLAGLLYAGRIDGYGRCNFQNSICIRTL